MRVAVFRNRLAELALELPHAGFPRVVGNHEAQHLVADDNFVGTQPVPLDLTRPEMPARDRELLVAGVAVEADHLHAVEQRARDRLGDVRGRNEQHMRQVELDVEVMIAKRVVLSRVEHFEQRRRRIAAPVGAELVDLVEHDDRVHRARHRAVRARGALAARRYTCADARESRLRRGRRRATSGRTGARSRARSIRQSRSCPFREGR